MYLYDQYTSSFFDITIVILVKQDTYIFRVYFKVFILLTVIVNLKCYCECVTVSVIIVDVRRCAAELAEWLYVNQALSFYTLLRV